MRLLWAIAPGEHPSADSIGEVSGLAMDGDGTVYVSDFLATKVWVFDRDGWPLPGIGRKGEGPGEFEAPTGLGIGPDGRLYVRDVYRVSRFGPDSAGRLTRFEDSFAGPVYAEWRSKRASRFDTTGALLFPGTHWFNDGTTRRFFLRYDRDGELRDTLYVPAFASDRGTAWVRTSAGGGRMLRGLNHVPFAPLAVWDVTSAGTVVSGDAAMYDLTETDRAGRVIRRFRRDVSPERIPRQERRDSVAALRRRIDSIPVGLDRVEGMPEEVRQLDLPRTFPAYAAVYATPEGPVWVRRWAPATRAESVFDVFSRAGEYQRTVVLPRVVMTEPTPVLSLSGVVAVAIDPDTGENLVLRFRP
jgi:hypothetical protein